MPSQLGRQYRPPVLNANDAYLSQPLVDPSTCFAELPAGCSAARQKKAFAAEAAVVSKTQKVERVGPAIGSPGVLTIETDKTDRPGLLWVKTQSELRKAFKKHPCKGMGAVLILHHADKVIRITHQTAVSTNVALDSFDKPQVQYIM